MSQPATPGFIQGTKKLLIGGQWVEPSSGQRIEAINPATGELLCHVAQGNAQDVDRAVAAARRAFKGPWSRFTPHERRKLLLRVHDTILDNFEELALIETLDMGAPLARTRGYKEWLSVGFGGTKMSGYGWKGGKEHVESFLYPKATYFNFD